MKINRNDIVRNIDDKFVEQFISYATEIDSDFDSIIKAELALGNKISDVSKGWPNTESIVISFKKPLNKNHTRPTGIYFEIPNDPKGWSYQYSNFNYTNENVVHMLISGK